MVIREEGPEHFGEHGKIPVTIWGKSRVDLDALRQGEIKENPCDPFVKDYDDFEDQKPVNLPYRFNVDNWMLLTAYDPAGHRIGGVLIAKDGYLPDQTPGQGVIVDIRVRPDLTRRGAGRFLIQAAREWAQTQGLQTLQAETQDTNVAACRFYQATGFQVESVEEDAYQPDLDEARIIWLLK